MPSNKIHPPAENKTIGMQVLHRNRNTPPPPPQPVADQRMAGCAGAIDWAGCLWPPVRLRVLIGGTGGINGTDGTGGRAPGIW